MSTTKTKESKNDVKDAGSSPSSDRKNELATIGPASVPMSAEAREKALQTWTNYERLLTLPFVPKEACADLQPWFSIVAFGEREAPSLNDPDVLIDQWVILVEFEEDAELETRGKEIRAFKRGDQALITLNKGAVQNKTITVLSNIIAECGAVPNMTLRQLKPKKPGWNGAIVLTAASLEG